MAYPEMSNGVFLSPLLTNLLLQVMMACVFSSHISPLLKCRQVSLNLAVGRKSMAAGINTYSTSCSP